MNIDYSEPVKFVGSEQVNIDYHHGQLLPAVGASSVQVLRANRKHPEEAAGTDWTYNHAPMLAHRRGKFYLEYLSTPVEEHVPPGQTLLTSSPDGVDWAKPRVVFPVYAIPDGVFEHDGKRLPPGTQAIMHQRMGFYEAPNGRFLILGNYGICPAKHQVPFGRFSIGRVVREIHEDDSLGPIYFIRYNVGTVWNESNTHYPLYLRSPERGFVEACEALMDDPLVTQQWGEEQGDADELITVKSKDGGAFYNKAFCWYRLTGDTIIGLWKWMKAAVSHDNGRSWSDVAETPTVKHAGAKIWGQKTSDGRYALVYNPHTNNTCRWPLAVAAGDDGLVFDRMACIIGDLSPKRYAGGPYKGSGFHYVRGLETREAESPDGALYVVYSVNKEDIWISRVPVPVTDAVDSEVHETFEGTGSTAWVEGWNIYSPRWAPVRAEGSPDEQGRCLHLRDFDPYDYAKAERVFKPGNHVTADFRIMAGQEDPGCLYIELWDGAGRIPFRLIFDEKGALVVVHGRKREKRLEYRAKRWYDVRLTADAVRSSFDVEVDGVSLSSGQAYQGQGTSMKGWWFNAPAARLCRIVFRTGPLRRWPTIDQNWTDFQDLPGAGEKNRPVDYYVKSLEVGST